MAERVGYREWARSVRSEARRNLSALRAERLARRHRATDTASAAPKAATSAERLPMSASRCAASLVEPPSLDLALHHQENPNMSLDATQPAVDVAKALPDETAEHTAVVQSVTEMSDAIAEAGEAESSDNCSDEVPHHESSADELSAFGRLREWSEVAFAESDLTRLPGAGTGLVWLLQVNGIASLSDLASADPEDLVERLGLIGRLIDVEDWIGFAAASASPSVVNRPRSG